MADIAQKLKIGALVAGAALFVVACGSKPAETTTTTETTTVETAPADTAPVDATAAVPADVTAAPADATAAPADPLAAPPAEVPAETAPAK